MPTYRYKRADCEVCTEGFSVTQRFSDAPLGACPACGGMVRRAIGKCHFKFRHTQRPNYYEYREDLSRFPGDPEAWVSSPTDVKKLWDKRQREGWTRKDVSVDRACATKSGEIDYQGLMDEAIREAAATNFDPTNPDVKGVIDDFNDGPPRLSE